MAYQIEKIHLPKMYLASMSVTLPEYSVDLYEKAMETLKKELSRMDVELAKPDYSFTVKSDAGAHLDLVTVELYVSVEKMVSDTDSIHFIEIDESETLRIRSDEFTDIHIGLAEWMHDHDYMADGDLRRLTGEGSLYVYDCPIKPSED